MDNAKAIEIIRRLAEGIDPFTGEVFSAGSPYQNVQTVRALYKALEVMGKREQRKNQPASAGNKWTDEESQSLATEFDSGMSVDEIAQRHQRTKVAIVARLVKIGKAASRDEALAKGR